MVDAQRQLSELMVDLLVYVDQSGGAWDPNANIAVRHFVREMKRVAALPPGAERDAAITAFIEGMYKTTAVTKT